MQTQKQITITLDEQEWNYILSVLGDLPTKSGAWPLIIKIQHQANPPPSADPIPE